MKHHNFLKTAVVIAVMLLQFSNTAMGDLFESAISGEEETPEKDDSENRSTTSNLTSGWNFDLNGHLRGNLFVGKMPDYRRGEMKSAYGELGLKLQVNKANFGDAFGEVRFQAGYLNDEHYLGEPSYRGSEGADIGEFHSRVKLRETYLDAYLGPLDIRFGYQIIVWGRADGVNPTNNLTPIDMRVRSPEEDDRRLGNIGVRANLNLSPIRVEGVWMPIYTPSLIPYINFGEFILFSEPAYPSMDLQNGTLAGRIHLLLPQFEMSVSYLHGYGLTPGISLDDENLLEAADTGVPPWIAVKREAFDQHVVGLDFSTALGSFMGLRGEVAFRYPQDYKDRIYAPNPDIYYVIGGDKEFGNVSIIAQYFSRYTFDWKEPTLDLPIDVEVDMDHLDETIYEYGGFLTPTLIGQLTARELAKKNQLIHTQQKELQHSASLRVEWKTLHDTLSLSLFSMVNFSTEEWLLYPKITYAITDAMLLAVGGEIYMGPDDTLLGIIDEIMSAGYASLKITF